MIYEGNVLYLYQLIHLFKTDLNCHNFPEIFLDSFPAKFSMVSFVFSYSLSVINRAFYKTGFYEVKIVSVSPTAFYAPFKSGTVS